MRSRNSIRRTATALIVFIALALVAIPMYGLNASATDSSITAVDRVFRVGVTDMSISTLNPNTYTTTSEQMIIFPLYSFLIQWDQSGENVIGDLAKDWWISPDGLTWEFDLVETAYWVEYDPDTEVLTKGPRVTAEDVKWSVDTLAAEDQSNLNSIWPEGIIAETWTDGDYHFGITITEPFAPMQDSIMTQIIFPKYIWENEDFITFDNVPTVSSGAFYYKTNGLPDAGYAELARNPYWHGETSYGWQLHCDEFVMCRYDDPATCWSALKYGDIDAMIGVPPPIFVNELPENPELIGFHQSKGFVYEFNLNQMTDEMRSELGGAFNAGESNQLLQNDSVKSAISMCIDKNGFVEDVLYGYGDPADSLVPLANPWHYDYPDPITFDPSAARETLMQAGWNYDLAGNLATASTIPLCKAGGTDPLSFRFYTLNSAQEWLTGALMIVDWCSQAGVQLNLEVLSVNEMNSAWYSADYDLWLWDWVFDPLADPAMSMLEVLTTDAIGTDSDVFYSDPVYDALYEESLVTMDPVLRAQIIDEMQAMAYEDRSCQCIAYREDLYAFNTMNWQNFGDLNSDYMMLPDVSSLWISMCMYPSDNAAPTIGGISVSTNTVSGVAEVGVPVSFTALGVMDDYQDYAELSYTWIWDFGGEKQVDVSPMIDHTFTADGVYTVTLVVKETAPVGMYEDYLSSYETYEVIVHDMSNSAPHDLEISMNPLNPTTGELVSFSGSAVDDEGDDLYYTWNFGDGSVLAGQYVEHQFSADGSYVVTLMVDDRHYGEIGSRPVTLTAMIVVGPNYPPMISVPDFGSVDAKIETTFQIYASDPDGDNLMFVWEWGDGTSTITYEPVATHSYMHTGTYEITVTVSDLTGLPNHEISDSGMVYVISGHNKHGSNTK